MSPVVDRVVSGPVDHRLAGGVRLRHLPGSISLGQRTATSLLPATPGEELARDIRACIEGRPTGLSLLKARPQPGNADTAAGPDGFQPALLDVGIGPNANLVLTDLSGLWSWGERTCVFPNGGAEIRSRLEHMDLGRPGATEPSLLYDAPDHPTSVQVEVTTRCNLGCAYCTNRLLPTTEDTDVDRVLAYFDAIDFQAVDNVDFTGLGEAALHRGLPRLVAEVARRGSPAHIRLVTNGTVIPRRVFEPLCEAGLTSIAFSVDSLDPTRFARARKGARLEPVLRNLESLAAYRRETGIDRLEIKIKAVLCDEPYAEAERILTYSARLGVCMPHFATLDSREDVRDVYREPWLSSPMAAAEGATFLHWCTARWRELGGQPDPEPVHPTTAERRTGYRHPHLVPADLCRWAVDAAFVAGNGTALSCCEQMMDVPRHAFGSLTEQSMQQLWNGDLLWAYRLPLALHVVPSGCVGCAYAPPPDQGLLEVSRHRPS